MPMSAMSAAPVMPSLKTFPTAGQRRAGFRRVGPVVVCRAAKNEAQGAKVTGVITVAATTAGATLVAPSAHADEAGRQAAQELAAQLQAQVQPPPAASDAAAEASAAAADAVAQAQAAAAASTAQAAEAAAAAKAQAAAALSGVAGSAGKALGGVTAGAGAALGGAANVAGSALGGAANVVGKGAGVVGDGLGAASSAVGGAASTVAGTAGQAASAVSSTAGQTLTAATDAANAAAAAVGAAALGAVHALEAVLPPEFAAVVKDAETNPDAAVSLLVLAAAVPLALSAVGAATRGYAGERRPFVVDEELRTDSRAFLVDTRSEEARRNDGVPDLREKQRGKGAAVQIEELKKDVRGQVRSARAVELELAAMKVKALTKGGGRVYVMGPNAVDLAKAVTALGGRRAFVVAGGFEAWRSSGLKVRSNGKYEKSALDAIGEDTSAAATRFTQKVSANVQTVKTVVTSGSPADAVPVLAGLALAAAAAYNYETTLQYAGVIGIEITLLAKLLSYDSPMELFEDLKESVAGAAAAVGTFEAPAFEMPEVSVPSMPEMSVPSMPAAAPVMEEKVVKEQAVEEEVVAEVVEELAEEVVAAEVVEEAAEVVEEVAEVVEKEQPLPLVEESVEEKKDM